MTSSAESATSATATSRSKGLRIALWGVQLLLGAMFTMAGVMKATAPIPELVAKGVIWAKDIPEPLVRFIGASEFLGAMGLLLPSLTRIKPILTPVAAIGLATIMALAVPFHLSRGEPAAIVFNLVLGGLAAFIAWGRFAKAPIARRG